METSSNFAVTSYSAGDGLVFSECVLGHIFERRGVVIMFRNADSEGDVCYTDEYGSLCGEWNDNLTARGKYTLIGKVGDTIVPKDLESAIYANLQSHNDSIDTVFYKAERYFTIDKSVAEDILKVRIRARLDEEGEVLFNICSDYYSFGGVLHFNLRGGDYGSKFVDYNLREAFIEPLAFYRRYIGKEIGIDIDFANETYFGLSPEKIKADNVKIDALRRKYLPGLRKYIADKVAAELAEDTPDHDIYKEYETLNMDGKIITI